MIQIMKQNHLKSCGTWDAASSKYRRRKLPSQEPLSLVHVFLTEKELARPHLVKKLLKIFPSTISAARNTMYCLWNSSTVLRVVKQCRLSSEHVAGEHKMRTELKKTQAAGEKKNVQCEAMA